MNAFYKIAAVAALLLASVTAQANPIETKISGNKFDVYYDASGARFNASVVGNKLVVSLNNFSVAPFSGEQNDSLYFTDFRIVAHDGVTVNSNFSSTFRGGYFFNPMSAGTEQFRATVTSSLVANESPVFEVAYSTSDVHYMAYNSSGYGFFDSENAPGQDYYDLRDPNAYKEYLLGFKADLYAYAQAPVLAYISDITFAFETIDTGAASDVPEPASLALLGIGALALMRRRSRK